LWEITFNGQPNQPCCLTHSQFEDAVNSSQNTAFCGLDECKYVQVGASVKVMFLLICGSPDSLESHALSALLIISFFLLVTFVFRS
jgi:hypothetical protein